MHHQNRGAWKLANFRNFALTCHAPCTLNSNFINFHTSNGFLLNITIVPYIKTFPTITHMLMFGFGKWHFRRGDVLGIIVHNMLKLITQAYALPTTRPFQLNYISDCIWHWVWAFYMIMQAHAMNIHLPCTRIWSHLPCLSIYK